jgi:hypothetical protein
MKNSCGLVQKVKANNRMQRAVLRVAADVHRSEEIEGHGNSR